MNATNGESWGSVWLLYIEHSATFYSVFRTLARRGLRVPPDRQVDLIHEFLLERAPQALASFRPERGELDGWLFVVFRRFASGMLKRDVSQERRLRRLDAAPDSALWTDEGGSHSASSECAADLDAARSALAALPRDERKAMRFLLQPAGSLRSVARELAISRWRAERLVESALERLARVLGPSSFGDGPESIEGLRRALEITNKTGE